MVAKRMVVWKRRLVEEDEDHPRCTQTSLGELQPRILQFILSGQVTEDNTTYVCCDKADVTVLQLPNMALSRSEASRVAGTKSISSVHVDR